MPTLRSSSVSREVCLRKHLLNKIFLQTLSHDDPLDDHHSVSEPSLPAACLLIPPNSSREQPAISEISENDVEMKNEEILLETKVGVSSGPTETQIIDLDSENCLSSYVKCNDNQDNAFGATSNGANLQDSLCSVVTASQIELTTETDSSERSEAFVPTVQTNPGSSKRMSNKYSKIIARIETIEKSVATFCDKENELSSDVAALKCLNSISVFQNINSSRQKKKYKKYFNRTLKVCTRLEGEISLYSQYVATLETAVSSIPNTSKLYKTLEAKLKTAYKFQEENPSHEVLKTLMRQLKLVNLLIEKSESESEPW